MRVVNPTYGKAKPGSEMTLAAVKVPVPNAPVNWQSDAIVRVSNSKANANELLEGVNLNIQKIFKRGPMAFVSKSNSGLPAPDSLFDQVAGNYRGALVALGD